MTHHILTYLDHVSEILLCGSSRHRGEPQLGFAALGAALPLALGDMEDGVWKKFLRVLNVLRLLNKKNDSGQVAISNYT